WLIDDLDHLGSASLPTVSGRVGSWFTNNDGEGDDQFPPFHQPFPTADAGDEGEGDGAFVSRASGYTESGASFGIIFNLAEDFACAHDVSGYTGVRFKARLGDETSDTEQELDVSLPIIEI